MGKREKDTFARRTGRKKMKSTREEEEEEEEEVQEKNDVFFVSFLPFFLGAVFFAVFFCFFSLSFDLRRRRCDGRDDRDRIPNGGEKAWH